MNKYENLTELGKRIRQAREEAKLTQYQLHDLTGISITQISAYENGNRNIGLQTLHKIATATNKTMDEIYCGTLATKPLVISKNLGELIVNCVSALVDEEVITLFNRQDYEDFSSTYSNNHCSKIEFIKYVKLLTDMVNKLIDFNKNKENYPDPENFKKQILAATAKQINKTNKNVRLL